MNYILVTAARNEESNLTNLILSIENQSILPRLWVIIDDGSTDNTSKLLFNAERTRSWIKIITLKNQERDIGIHYAEICKIGFDYAINQCNLDSIIFNFLGLIDADMLPDPRYFESLLVEFNKNYKLGIASGGVYYFINDKYILEKTSVNHARGGTRLIRKECYESVSGISISHSPDTVMDIKAKFKGWDIKQFKHIKCIQTRPTNSVDGFWKGGLSIGDRMYYLNYNPLLICGAAILLTLRKPHFTGFAVIYSYISNLIKASPKIEDKDIRNYFWYKRWIDSIKNIFTN